jgi:hypothetical protein
MKKKLNQSRPYGQLDKKLAAYTLAGAAVLVAPGIAKASVVYVSVGQTVNGPGAYDFNLSGPAAADVTITANDPTTAYAEIDAGTNNGAQVLLAGTPGSNVAALAFGDLIDPTSGVNWGGGGKMASGFGPDPGSWPTNGGDAYLGFYFQGASGPQAGWADIATTANTFTAAFTIIDYGYETDANTAITAGEGRVVPEPSALPLLVLGGAGLIALRRRRAAHA